MKAHLYHQIKLSFDKLYYISTGFTAGQPLLHVILHLINEDCRVVHRGFSAGLHLDVRLIICISVNRCCTGNCEQQLRSQHRDECVSLIQEQAFLRFVK